MTEGLADLSLVRLSSSDSLPDFPGNTVVEKMVAGREAARAALKKHVPNFKFDVNQARDVVSLVNAWVERNQEGLAQAFLSPSNELPSYLVLNMGSKERVQQWLIANFTIAAEGMGPWLSGEVERASKDPQSPINERWASSDALKRIAVFSMIVKMDRDGELAAVFGSEQSAAILGFGAVPPVIVGAVIVALVSLAAVVTYYYLESKKLEVNNKLMADLCRDAQKRGDEATVQKCIEAVRDLQVSSPLDSMVREVVKVLMVMGVGYVAIKYGLPALERMGKKS